MTSLNINITKFATALLVYSGIVLCLLYKQANNFLEAFGSYIIHDRCINLLTTTVSDIWELPALYIGMSGGGWYVTILSALIENIDISISFSGTRSIPFQYYSDGNSKDLDFSYSKIYNFLDYEDLYYLATLDLDGDQNRYHYQIYDFNEENIFGGKFAESMKKISDKFNNKFFKVKLKYDDKHDINLKMIHKIINNIKSVKNK